MTGQILFICLSYFDLYKVVYFKILCIHNVEEDGYVYDYFIMELALDSTICINWTTNHSRKPDRDWCKWSDGKGNSAYLVASSLVLSVTHIPSNRMQAVPTDFVLLMN